MLLLDRVNSLKPLPSRNWTLFVAAAGRPIITVDIPLTPSTEVAISHQPTAIYTVRIRVKVLVERTYENGRVRVNKY